MGVGGGTQLVRKWETLTGSDAAHSARVTRALMLGNQFPIGKQGRAALLNTAALTNFLLADMTGDAISTASARATLWSSLVCDGSPQADGAFESEAAKIFREWAEAVKASNGTANAQAQHSVLPGADLGAGIAALLDRMSNNDFDVLFKGRMVPFTQIVSHVSFDIELRIGGNEGPQAIVQYRSRQSLYSAKVEPPERLRNAAVPKQYKISIETRHLATLASLWADTKARMSGALPVPPSRSVSPADPENGNAEAIPIASAPSDYQPHDNGRMNADATHADQCSHGSDHIVCVCVSSIRVESEAGLTTSNRRRTHDPTSHHHALL